MIKTKHWVCCDSCERVSEGYQIHEPGWIWISDIKAIQAQERNGGFELKEVMKAKTEHHFCSSKCLNLFFEKQFVISTKEIDYDDHEKYAS